MLRPWILFLGVLIPLGAQSWGSGGRPQNDESLRQLTRVLDKHAFTLVVFDTREGAWREAFEQLTAEDTLAEVRLLLRVAGSGSGPALYKREEWKPGPHWALMDERGTVLAHGATLPQASTLRQAVEATGLPSRLEGLRAFVRQHPDQFEAREALVLHLRDAATRRALKALGLRPPPPPDPSIAPRSFGDVTGFSHSNVPSPEEQLAKLQGKDLPSDRDETIWGDYARELAKVFENDGWAAVPFAGTYKATHTVQRRLVSPLARFSPLCRDTCERLLPKIEALLERYPSHGRAWQLWCDFAQVTGRSAKPLLASLTPPSGPATDWPPIILRRTLLQQAREGGDWRAVTEFSSEIYDQILGMAKGERAYANSGKATKGFKPSPWLDEQVWDTVVSPLVEAYLAQDKVREAEGVLSTWEDFSGWKGAYAKAAELARKTQRPELAKTWEQKGA